MINDARPSEKKTTVTRQKFEQLLKKSSISVIATGMSIKNVVSITNLCHAVVVNYFDQPKMVLPFQAVTGSIVFIVGFPFYIENADHGLERFIYFCHSRNTQGRLKLLFFSLCYSASQAGTLILAGLPGSENNIELKPISYILGVTSGLCYFFSGFANIPEALENFTWKKVRLPPEFLEDFGISIENIRLRWHYRLLASASAFSYFIGASLLFSDLYFRKDFDIAIKSICLLSSTIFLGFPASLTPYGIGVIGLSKFCNPNPIPVQRALKITSFATSTVVNGIPSAWLAFTSVLKGSHLVLANIFDVEIPTLQKVVTRQQNPNSIFWILSILILIFLFLPSLFCHTINKAYPILTSLRDLRYRRNHRANDRGGCSLLSIIRNRTTYSEHVDLQTETHQTHEDFDTCQPQEASEASNTKNPPDMSLGNAVLQAYG